jgi:hypothetical protein
MLFQSLVSSARRRAARLGRGRGGSRDLFSSEGGCVLLDFQLVDPAAWLVASQPEALVLAMR